MTETKKLSALVELATYATGLGYPGVDEQALDSPNFANPEWLFSWEWYVDEALREIWPLLSMEARWVAYIGACHRLRVDNELAS